MMYRYIVFSLALLLGTTASLSAASESAPKFPDNGLLEYSAAIVEEQLESQKIERVKLSGSKPILTELIPGLTFTPGPQKGPFVYAAKHYPDTHASLYAFQKERFFPKINPETLNQYLARKQLEAPEESNFEIIEEATRDTGPAKFRFLGGKAYTLTYDYEKIDSLQEQKRFRCTENWRLHEGIFYVIIVEAPVRGFAKHYRLVAGSVNNMHFID